MKRVLVTMLVGLLTSMVLVSQVRGDELRNVKRGEKIPAFRLPTLSGQVFSNESLEGKAYVLVYLSAEQKSSELAAAESQDIARKYADEPIRFIHATADIVHRAYFEKLREDKGIELPLGLDPARDLYASLGMIVFPTTIVVDREGRLMHVISTRGPDYAHELECYVKHALGILDDEGLTEALTARTSQEHSPQSLASRHRAAARLLRDKGLLDSAEAELTAALEYDPDNRDVKLDLADLYLLKSDGQRAEEIVDAILAEDPRHHRARLLKGIALFRMWKLDEAERILKEVLVLNPDPARTHYYLGLLYELRGQQDQAVEHYREALRRLLNEPGLPPSPESEP